MRRELGIARCGLACCLCSENGDCDGCESESCPDAATCRARSCSMERGLAHSYVCPSPCDAMEGAQLKARAFRRHHIVVAVVAQKRQAKL